MSVYPVGMRDTISRYFDEISRLSLPTKEEERARFLEYRALTRKLETVTDPTERVRITSRRARLGGLIAQGYLRFVINKARDRTRDEEALSEYISAGNEGLMVAVMKYDPEYVSQDTGKPVRFLTYADYWVRVKMDDVLHKRGTVHVSVHLRKQTMQRGDGPPSVVMTPIDDVQIASDDDVERDATPQGRTALSQIHAAGLTRCEKVILVLSLGLRGTPRTDEEIGQILFCADGSVFLPAELRGLREGAIEKMRRWHAEHPEARGELAFS